MAVTVQLRSQSSPDFDAVSQLVAELGGRVVDHDGKSLTVAPLHGDPNDGPTSTYSSTQDRLAAGLDASPLVVSERVAAAEALAEHAAAVAQAQADAEADAEFERLVEGVAERLEKR